MRSSILGQTVHDIAQVKWVSASKTVSKTVILAAVASANLENRKFVLIHNLSSTKVMYAIPSSTDTASLGLPIPPGEERLFCFGDAVSVYLVTSAGNATSIIAEGY